MSNKIKWNKTERDFVKAAPKEWLFLRHANEDEDMFEHWDLEFLIKNKKIKLDIKKHRDTKRNSGIKLVDWFVMETVNVKGNPGWLLGLADYIAFEYFNDFLIYNRIKLKERSFELTDFNKYVYDIRQAKNCITTRWGRKDIIYMNEISKLPAPNLIISK